MPDQHLEPAQREAFYLPLTDGRRFCILHRSRESGAHSRSILYVHPFAEEMNKSRRMAALQARALAAAGWQVLQIDLAGCGDSDGDFADASWGRWVSDVGAAATWLRERFGQAPWLWGLRAGCLIAADAAREISSPGLVFWQPVLSGQQFLQQFLRLRVAAQVLSAVDAARIDTRELHAQLAQGRAVEVAGYSLSPAIALGMRDAELTPVPENGRVVWIEVAGGENPELAPAAQARADAWRGAGHPVETRCVAGQPFWQTQEIVECPAMIQATLAALSGVKP